MYILLNKDGFLTDVETLEWVLQNGDIPVIIFEGENDFMVPANSIEAIINKLNFDGSEKLQKQDYSVVDGGKYKKADNLEVYFINDSGHMIPWDQPKIIYEIMNKFVK